MSPVITKLHEQSFTVLWTLVVNVLVHTVQILTLLPQHSFINLKAMIQIFLRVDPIFGAEGAVSRRGPVEDAAYPGVNQRHGAHDTRLPGHIEVVPGAYVRLRARFCIRKLLKAAARISVKRVTSTSLTPSHQVDADHDGVMKRVVAPAVMTHCDDPLHHWVDHHRPDCLHSQLASCPGSSQSRRHVRVHPGFLRRAEELSSEGDRHLFVLMKRGGPVFAHQLKLGPGQRRTGRDPDHKRLTQSIMFNSTWGEQRVDGGLLQVWCLADEADEDLQRMKAALHRPHPLDMLEAVQRVEAVQLPDQSRCLLLVHNGRSKRLDQLDILWLLIWQDGIRHPGVGVTLRAFPAFRLRLHCSCVLLWNMISQQSGAKSGQRSWWQSVSVV